MQTKLTIVSLVGVGVLLLVALAAISAPGAQIAYAQSPSITIRFSSSFASGEGRMVQGDQLFAQYTFGNIQSVTCEADLSFIDFGDQRACFHRSEVYPRNADTTNPDNRVEQYEGSDFGNDRSFSPRTGNSRVIGFSHNQVPPDCPPGEYTLKVILMGSTGDDDPNTPAPFLKPVAATNTKDFRVEAGSATATPTYTPRPQPPPPHTPTPTPTLDTLQPPPPTATPTLTRDPNAPTATPTPTRDTQQPPPPTATPTPTRDTQQPPPPTATPTPTRDPLLPTLTPTATSTRDPLLPTLTPTATSTRDPLLPTLTPTATPTVDGNGGQGNEGQGNGGQGNEGQGNGGQGNEGQGNGGQGNGGQGNGGQGNGGQGNGGQGNGNNQVKSSVGDFTPQMSQQKSQHPIAITLPDEMNVRNGPGLECDIVTTVPAGTRAWIIGLDPDDDWYQVEIEGVVGQAWIYQDLTTLIGSLAGVKRYTPAEIAQITGTPPTATNGSVPLAITVPITMNVRTGPGLDYDVVRVVPKGTQGRIYGIDPNDDWFQIELEGLDTLVWVYQDLTTVVGSLAGVKRVTEDELALLPAAITLPALLNARAGPGLAYDILATIPQGTWAKITGIDIQGDWYRVELANVVQPAWIYRDFTKVAGGSLTGLIQITVADPPTPAAEQLTSSITVDLSIPSAGGVVLEVSWLDAIACAQFYNLYHRADTGSNVYISLDQAVTALSAISKSLSFTTLSGSSYISAWCGTNAAGREVAEVEIDPGVAGTYSSTTTSGKFAAAPPHSDDDFH